MVSRQKFRVSRRNFFPTLMTTLLLWFLLGSMIYFVDPGSFLAIPGFFVLLFFASLFLFSIIFANSRRGAVLAFSLILFLILRYFGMGNILNLLLLLGLVVAVEVFFSKA